YRLSPDHYWKVDGILPATFKASATVTYEGRTTSFSGNYYQDNNLINTTEDSLVLMYRRNAADDWHVYPYYSKNYVGTHTDKHGVITIDTLQLGEYVYAMMDPALGVKNDPASAQLPSLKVFPNPAKDIITVDIYGSFGKIPVNSVLVVTDISGKTIFNEKLQQQNTININTSAFTSGVYFISIKSKDELVGKSKFVVAH
ncbi:MAG: T9SS type A sorting domain-containing protein, partial [Bacteroidia bacterium]